MKLLIYLTILCASLGCGSTTTYRPWIHGHSALEEAIIVPQTKERIYCNDEERFQKYVSVSILDLQKLALILKHAKVPKKVRIIVENFRKDVEKLKEKEEN